MYESDDIDWTLLDRYVANEATEVEAQRVESWADAHPSRAALLAAMRVGSPPPAWDVAAAWSAVQSRVRRTEPVQTTPGRSQPTAWLRAAAVIALLGGAALLGRALLQRSGGASAGMLSAVTARSERDTIQLADGSTVILSAASTLDYPRSFTDTARDVRLTGEALFRVTADRTRPFRVHTAHAIVEVVGTQFVTRTSELPSAAPVTVAVLEGAVSVAARGDTVLVRPGEVAHVANDGSATVQTTDLAGYVDWLDGRLDFDDAPLAAVLAELQRWYPLQFAAHQTLLQRRVTARLRVGALEETISALALALGADHERRGDTITFTLQPGSR